MVNALPKTPRSHRFTFRVPAPKPFPVAIAVLIVSLIVAPLCVHPVDVLYSWLPWSRASGGVAPWRIYEVHSDCNYPPLVLYLLTACEAVRLASHVPNDGPFAILLVKFPNILAHVAGALAGYFLLRRITGEMYARRFAFLYCLALPLFVNASLWGQTDTLIALPMVCAVAFLMRGSPVRAGIAIGVALSAKLQAIVIVPVLLLYAWKKFGWKISLRAGVAGIAVLLFISLPIVMAGSGVAVMKAYTGAVGFFQLRTVQAFNLWHLLNYVDVHFRHVSPDIVNQDNRTAVGLLTYRDVGLVLFAVALSFLLACLWRRTTARMLAWAAALSVWAFVSLCTEMHQRYWVPGAALLLIVAPESLFALGFALLAGFTSTANQWLSLCLDGRMHPRIASLVKSYIYFGGGKGTVLLSSTSLLLLAVGMAYVGRNAASHKDGEKPGAAQPEQI